MSEVEVGLEEFIGQTAQIASTAVAVSEALNLDQLKQEAYQAQQEYVQGVVGAAMERAGVTVTSPGYHNARFAATEAVKIVLLDAAQDERDQKNQARGDQ
jgi:DNA polymerase III epsilon subunit-like protein